AYTLWMVKRVYFGAVANHHVAELEDLDRREFWMLGVLAAAVLAMGLYPKPFTDVMHESVAQLLRQTTIMNWQAIYPEILLLAAACLVALVDLWVKDPKRLVTYSLTQASLFLLAMLQLWYFADGFTLYAMQRMVVADPMGHLL